MSENIRKAALALHGISTKDKKWIMARLPEGVQRELNGCIAELDRLGVRSTDIAGVDLSRIQSSNNDEKTPFDMALQNSFREGLVSNIENFPLPVLLDWVNSEAEWLAAQAMCLFNDSRILRALEEVQIDKAIRIRKLKREMKKVPPFVADSLLRHLGDELSEISCNSKEQYPIFSGVSHDFRSRIMERFSKWSRSFVLRK